ncbi:sugar hydrolase [Paenibacillus sp. MMS20-IR301]|uniref:alpha-L-rhamnosidase-related protein n=1 Tax=Paenibacillus sp. MMS20-IR301 TaxID=2895946 RepID=UPI0028F0A2C0|nr:sugar hydrolase [Paenibacillus sp. MMS20-IR301]WNS40817.1 sugar hydrolase [Paenibacillus sp. MMS20-IR301]
MGEPKMQAVQAIIEPVEAFIAESERLKPELYKRKVTPGRLIEVIRDETVIHGWKTNKLADIEELKVYVLGKGDSIILDFSDHRVGFLSFKVRPVGSPPDAPLKLKLTFGEMPVEMAEPFSEYEGWVSSSWLQEETLYIDVLPRRIELPRRYSFRYLKLEVLATSVKYRVVFEDVICNTVTSADHSAVRPLDHPDALLQEIDRVSIRTLEDCMHDVFEDGPKRDRRLWLGDLRLQALANYATFRNFDLVKRCLYLFAGVPDQKGRVSANLFKEPAIIADDTYLFDYSLFYTTSLFDYYTASKDEETLKALWPTAKRQVELAIENLDPQGLVQDQDTWWAFIDWHPELNKQASSQAILIYTIKRAIQLAEILNCDSKKALADALTKAINGAFSTLWDPGSGFFVSGAGRQVSWATQIWFALAEVFPKEQNKQLMLRLLNSPPAIGLSTPYMHHHLVEALLVSGCTEEGVACLKSYWGGMLTDGADTFWELYDPSNKNFSPYGSYLINSYCHAWSCTPTYLIRQYGL